MKKIIIILIAVSSLSLFSCEGLLIKTPINTGTFDNINSERDLDLLLGTTEWNVRESNTVSLRFPLMIGELADTIPAIKDRNWKNFDISGRTATFSWDFMYKIDAVSRVILEHLHQVEMTQERKEYYEGSASFYIAYSYFNLVRRWGEVPIMRNGIEDFAIAKSTWPEVIDYVIEMATKASEMLPELHDIRDSKGNKLTRRSTPCRGAALAILADAAAWKAGGKYHMNPADRNFDENEYWKIVETSTSGIISKSSLYSLVGTAEEICTKVLIGESQESVWEITYRDGWSDLTNKRPGFNFFHMVQSYPLTGIGYNEKEALRYIMRVSTVENMYPDDDTRKNAYFYDLADTLERHPGGVLWGAAYPFKMREATFEITTDDKRQYMHFDQNKVEYRLSDIILLRAESRVRLGNDAGAIEDLNFVRNRSKATIYSTSEDGGDLRLTIFKEREKELLWEGKRYYDIIRNGYHREMLSSNHKRLSDIDYIDGAFFLAVVEDAFYDNGLMRQNKYWLRNFL